MLAATPRCRCGCMFRMVEQSSKSASDGDLSVMIRGSVRQSVTLSAKWNVTSVASERDDSVSRGCRVSTGTRGLSLQVEDAATSLIRRQKYSWQAGTCSRCLKLRRDVRSGSTSALGIGRHLVERTPASTPVTAGRKFLRAGRLCRCPF